MRVGGYVSTSVLEATSSLGHIRDFRQEVKVVHEAPFRIPNKSRVPENLKPTEPGLYELTLEPFCLDGERAIFGRELLDRASARGIESTIQHGLLLDTSSLPAELQNHYIVIPGTQYITGGEICDPEEERILPYHYCNTCFTTGAKSWCMGWFEVRLMFPSDGLFLKARRLS